MELRLALTCHQNINNFKLYLTFLKKCVNQNCNVKNENKSG